MELIVYAVLIYLAYLIIRWLIVHIILPAGKIAAIVALVTGTAIGAFFAFKSYIKSIIANINPYDYYEDHSKNRQEFAKQRNYFFGPGFVQLGKTVADAWKGIAEAIKWVFGLRKRISEAVDIFVLKQVIWLFSWLFVLCALIAIGILGGAITCILSVAHAAILLCVMAVIYVLFSITWIIDRIYLQMHSIKTNCPVCHARSVIPQFECPECHSLHTKLVPGPYGIWHRRCVCGKRLPTTFLLGRSRLNAYCPHCSTALAASDVQQFSISMVGGSSSGKTYLLASYFHEMFKQLDSNQKMFYEIPQSNVDMFNNIEDWFNGIEIDATQRNTSSYMYSVLMNSNALQSRRQYSIYDIAGETFEDQNMPEMSIVYHFRDSNGLVIVIDPLTSSDVRAKAAREGADVGKYARMDTAIVVENFAAYLKTVVTNVGAGKKDDRPVAVVITKTDLPTIDECLSYEHIDEMYRANSGSYENFSAICDAICEDFLGRNGFADAISAIKINFSNVHYFPVSAVGHAINGRKFTPQHVMEPFNWILCSTDAQLADVMGVKNPVASPNGGQNA